MPFAADWRWPFILSEGLEEAKALARTLGYTIEALPMTFSRGKIEIRRLSKIDRRPA
jgi:hypothetical protein